MDYTDAVNWETDYQVKKPVAKKYYHDTEQLVN